ncbi:MAG: nicotinate (nicotinamide) nucleotide adenylyltransferase [Bryobacteraceae bacterium]|nr:nicotinate (nicotinamide) nucleotide adenylyltransferase [Bryobacteraceae bacterium]
MRLALYGGTFDPVHSAHLAVAREAIRGLQLDHVWFVPNNRPPHKQAGPRASFADRVRMLELACAGDPRFAVSELEAGTERSYTIETLLKVRQQVPAKLFFLIGVDAFAEIHLWHRWREVILLTEFIVVTRAGYSVPEVPGATVHLLDTLHLASSSSAIREALARGERPADVPPLVLDYIFQKHLYA